MATQIQLRRGTEADWTSANPILASGEVAISTDLNKIKIGNGTSHWSSLSYVTDNTDEITEGSTNLYFTNQRALDATSSAYDAAGSAVTVQGNAESYADSAVSTHSSDTTNVHGIVDTSVLVTNSELALKADLNSPIFTGYVEFDGIVDFTESVVIGIDSLPDQTGESGKYLTTNGTDASWAEIPAGSPHPFSMIG